eukprot:TRINITY_DN2665_c0_g1_i1.p1 TRINITY_DN2665_c0_g1~~TRINITY_DN2665_c0_g1_i1.p1  ORF type:complete len:1051 (+),score=302.86 TRINITY_DN2665_c0_g1_i1:172-3324(+)
MNLNPTKNAMRGLTVFISDIRNAQSKENEEKRISKEMAHIRKEFKENKGIDGYQRRKYVCKLLYIYMLGYDLDFGHMEAVTLLSSANFQEKVIGYNALGMLLHENHELIPLIINSLQEDLGSRAPRAGEFFQCLALDAIGNIGGKEMAESLAPLVQKLLIANTSAPHVKKRAALALLRLFRKYPSIITPDLWATKLIDLLNDTDLGVLTSVVSLLLGLVQDNPLGWEGAIPKVVALLAKILITREYTKDYVYYSVPNPWLQTKLLRFLRAFPPVRDGATAARLSEILNVIFGSADTAKAGTVNHKNALNAVLFEAINLVIDYDNDDALLRQTCALLGRFISAKETNIRYLGLEAMSHLAALSTETSNMIKKYQETVFVLLRDADISIRRRALDLLYGMCDKYTSKDIVGELLTYLVSADYAIREELVLKIANLAEKFASNYQWYVDVILQLIATAGDFVSDDIWHRVIKIVINHEDVQEYAARTVFKALQSPTAHETTVKVGGYILGEFGHLISEQPESPAALQLQTLHSKYPTCGLPTRALLLSTYAKFVNLFPELAGQIRDIFAQYRAFIDAEIQQRACEYFNLTSLRDENLLSTVLDAIPAWNENAANESEQDGENPQDVNTTHQGHQQGGSSLVDIDLLGGQNPISNQPPPQQQQRNDDPFGLYGGGGAGGVGATGSFGSSNTASGGSSNINTPPHGATGSYGAGGYSTPPPSSGGMSDIFANAVAPGTGQIGLTAGIGAAVAHNNAQHQHGTTSPSPFGTPIYGSASASVGSGGGSPFGSGSPTSSGSGSGLCINDNPNDPLHAKISAFYRRLCLAGEGVLYEDGTLQIGIKTDYQKESGRMMIYYGNSTPTQFTNFQATITSTSSVQVQAQPVVSTIAPKAQVQQGLTLMCVSEVQESPILSISFVTNGKPVSIQLRLPVIATKFAEHMKLSAPDFFNQWKVWATKPLEGQEVFKAGKPIDVNWVSKVIQDGLKLAVLKGVDPSINNVVVAGYFNISGQQPQPVLARLETNPQTHMYRLTVRSSNEKLTSAVIKILALHLSASA